MKPNNDLFFDELTKNLKQWEKTAGEWKICSKCGGEGKSSAYLGAITEEDRELNWSPEEWDIYMSGGYDKTCEKCGGSGKVLSDENETKFERPEDMPYDPSDVASDPVVAYSVIKELVKMAGELDLNGNIEAANLIDKALKRFV